MKNSFLDSIIDKPFYRIIQQKYQSKVAKRSGLGYMSHIQEGIFIIQLLYGDDQNLVEAYCLHPIFQNDRLLSQLLVENPSELSLISPQAIVLGMEYRHIANNYTIKNKIKNYESIKIGSLEKVHKMLVADKIQNKKDFMKYMYLKHDRPSYVKASEHGLQYFDSWLDRLSVSQKTYMEITEKVEQHFNS
jgi:hypothetical protein